MEAAILLAKQHGVNAGAHPSFPDRDNFGRVDYPLRGAELETALTEQVADLFRIAASNGVKLTHLKPHGALYNLAAHDAGLADSVAGVTARLLPEAALYGPPNSKLAEAAAENDLQFVAEGFADRAYEDDGQLRSRTLEGALLTDPAAQAQQALDMVVSRRITTHSGTEISMPADTICIHGDSPTALRAAEAVVAALKIHGIKRCPPT